LASPNLLKECCFGNRDEHAKRIRAAIVVTVGLPLGSEKSCSSGRALIFRFTEQQRWALEVLCVLPLAGTSCRSSKALGRIEKKATRRRGVLSVFFQI